MCLLRNNLISMYAEFSNLRDAEKVFDEMSDRNIVTWTTLVSAFTDSGRPYEALRVYDDMPKSETANGYMYSAVLKACGLVGDLDRGKLIQERIYGGKLQGDTILMNSLMDMYVKCGSLSDAVKPNVVSWNSMIAGFADQWESAGDMFINNCNQAALNLIHTSIARYDIGLLHLWWCFKGRIDDALALFHRLPRKDIIAWSGARVELVTDTKLINSVANAFLKLHQMTLQRTCHFQMLMRRWGCGHNLSKAREAAKKVGVKRAGLSWIEVAS
ncbi:Pentatricopeptide repeat-containing protein, partial [Cucurbita argyrosperma subsp. argyrosperma]